jgi:membrane protein required for colicin V production
MDISILNFTLLDWLVAAILLYSVVISTVRGFFREVMGLITVVSGVILAAWTYREVGGVFIDIVASENIALFIGFFLVFCGTLIVGFTVIWIIYKFIEFAHVEWFDRLLGGAFGFVRGWLIGVVIFLGLTSFEIQSEVVRDSELSPYFLPGSRIVAVVTPFELKAKFLIGYDEVQRWWSENL